MFALHQARQTSLLGMDALGQQSPDRVNAPGTHCGSRVLSRAKQHRTAEVTSRQSSRRPCTSLMLVLLRGSQNPIFELKLLPILLAYRCSPCDDGHGRGSDVARVIIDGILQKETVLQIRSWYARVPTHSNLADAPSRRGEIKDLLSKACSRVFVNWNDVMRQCFPMG
ncbi:unnamed protein product [Symbiodinium sp. CCMP2456]|nr:unnamed protein product [Symbiodinium sp. CCMP2456]